MVIVVVSRRVGLGSQIILSRVSHFAWERCTLNHVHTWFTHFVFICMPTLYSSFSTALGTIDYKCYFAFMGWNQSSQLDQTFLTSAAKQNLILPYHLATGGTETSASDRQTCVVYCSKQWHQYISATSSTPRIEPGAAGWEVRMLPLCYGVNTTDKIPFQPMNNKHL